MGEVALLIAGLNTISKLVELKIAHDQTTAAERAQLRAALDESIKNREAAHEQFLKNAAAAAASAGVQG